MSEEEKKRRQAEKEPTDGQKSPDDPARRMPTGKPDEPETDAGNRDDDVPPWFATLPPEIRDAFAGGEYEKIPARYRSLIQRYFLWLQKNQKNK